MPALSGVGGICGCSSDQAFPACSAPCPVLAILFYRKGGKPQSSGSPRERKHQSPRLTERAVAFRPLKSSPQHRRLQPLPQADANIPTQPVILSDRSVAKGVESLPRAESKGTCGCSSAQAFPACSAPCPIHAPLSGAWVGNRDPQPGLSNGGSSGLQATEIQPTTPPTSAAPTSRRQYPHPTCHPERP